MQTRAAERAAKAEAIEQTEPAANGGAASLPAEITSNGSGKPRIPYLLTASLRLCLQAHSGSMSKHLSADIVVLCDIAGVRRPWP